MTVKAKASVCLYGMCYSKFSFLFSLIISSHFAIGNKQMGEQKTVAMHGLIK
jgi:hypothetical protein